MFFFFFFFSAAEAALCGHTLSDADVAHIQRQRGKAAPVQIGALHYVRSMRVVQGVRSTLFAGEPTKLADKGFSFASASGQLDMLLNLGLFDPSKAASELHLDANEKEN